MQGLETRHVKRKLACGRGLILKNFLAANYGLMFLIAGPLTYILSVLDTWHGSSSVLVKILINLTLDAILAFIWPITWVLWIIMYVAGTATPLNTILGL